MLLVHTISGEVACGVNMRELFECEAQTLQAPALPPACCGKRIA